MMQSEVSRAIKESKSDYILKYSLIIWKEGATSV